MVSAKRAAALRQAVNVSAPVQVFGCRHHEAIHALRRPASEKRQGTKSREVGHRRAAGAMEILPRYDAGAAFRILGGECGPVYSRSPFPQTSRTASTDELAYGDFVF